MKVLKRTLTVLLTFLVLSIATDSYAENAFSFAGAEFDTEGQGFSYLGLGIERDVDKEYSVIGKIFSGYLKYAFESEGKRLSVEVPMLTPSIGVRLKKGYIAITGSAGIDLRRTDRETISGGRERNEEAGISIQGETDIWGQGFKNLGIIASYSSIDSFFWGRIRAKKGILEISGRSNLLLGAELIGMGNKDFTATQSGLLLEVLNGSPNLSLLLKGGYKYTSTDNDSMYGGLEVYYGH